MATDYKKELAALRAEYAAMSQSMPEAMQGFGKLHHGTMSDGALDVKTKELIALGIGIAERCEGCIMAHVEAAYKNGATMEEIQDAIGVSIMMGGGPSTAFGGKALEIARQFSPDPGE